MFSFLPGWSNFSSGELHLKLDFSSTFKTPRELKEPLISWDTLEELMQVLQDSDKTVQEEEVMVQVNNIIRRMPQSNR